MGSTWKKQMSVGNAIIDSEHRNLLEMACNIEAMIKKKNASAVVQELVQFEYWLHDHFENEEEIALATNIDFTHNLQEHRNLLKEFQLLKDRLKSESNTLSDSTVLHYSHFLSDWLESHIIEEDMLMKPILQTYTYDFTPGRKTKPEAP